MLNTHNMRINARNREMEMRVRIKYAQTQKADMRVRIKYAQTHKNEIQQYYEEGRE